MSVDKPTLERRAYSSPLSFTGATSRVIGGCSRVQPAWWSVTLLVIVCALVVPVIWALLAVWYVLIFGVFGLLVIPWRLHRRSQRRAQHLAEAQLSLFQRATTGEAPAGGVPPVRVTPAEASAERMTSDETPAHLPRQQPPPVPRQQSPQKTSRLSG